MAMLSKLTYKFNAIPMNFPRHFFHKAKRDNPKLYMEPQKTQKCLSNSEEKEQSKRHKMECYLTLRKSKILPFAALWIDIDRIILK